MTKNNKEKTINKLLLLGVFGLNCISSSTQTIGEKCQQAIFQLSYISENLKESLPSLKIEKNGLLYISILTSSCVLNYFNFYYTSQIMLVVAFAIFISDNADIFYKITDLLLLFSAIAPTFRSIIEQVTKMAGQKTVNLLNSNYSDCSFLAKIQNFIQQNFQSIGHLNTVFLLLTCLLTQSLQLSLIPMLAMAIVLSQPNSELSCQIFRAVGLINALFLSKILLLPLITYTVSALLGMLLNNVASYSVSLFIAFAICNLDYIKKFRDTLSQEDKNLVALFTPCMILYMTSYLSIFSLFACLAISTYKAYQDQEGTNAIALKISTYTIVSLVMLSFYFISVYLGVAIGVTATLLVTLNCKIFLINFLAYCIYFIYCVVLGYIIGCTLTYLGMNLTPIIENFLKKNVFYNSVSVSGLTKPQEFDMSDSDSTDQGDSSSATSYDSEEWYQWTGTEQEWNEWHNLRYWGQS